MSFKIGLAGLCTSHPGAWLPIIREYAAAGLFDAEVAAVWDPGETRPEGFAAQFAAENGVPHAVERLEDMLDLVDGVIVHTANWDRHIGLAKPFVSAGKSVFLDKPIAGNMCDIMQYLEWVRSGARVTGGSALRYFQPSTDLLAIPESERGRVYTAYAAVGTDEFNYGVHGYAILASIMGEGIVSARYLGESNQQQIMLSWRDGKIGLLTTGRSAWLPFTMTVVTDRKVVQLKTEEVVYRAMIREVFPWFTGLTDTPPVAPEQLVEPELAARLTG